MTSAPQMSRWRWAAAGAVVLAAGVVLALTAFRGEESADPKLRALREDPLGRFVPRDGRLVRTHANNEKDGGAFSKPNPAAYTRLFALPPDGGAAAMQEAIDAATAAGWTMEPPLGDLGSVGEKQLSTGKATVAFSLITDPQALPDGTSAPVLSIGLEHNQ